MSSTPEQRAQSCPAADRDDARPTSSQAERVDDLDQVGGAVAREKWSKHGLCELQVAEQQQPDTEDPKDHCAGPVGQELEGDVVELVRQGCGLVELFECVCDT